MTIIKTTYGYKVIGAREVTVYFHWKKTPFTRVVVEVLGSTSSKDHESFDGEDALKYAIRYAMGRARVAGRVIFH